MTLITAYAARVLIKNGQAKVASVFRHWSTGGLYVVLDLGKASGYVLLNPTWESVFKREGLLTGAV